MNIAQGVNPGVDKTLPLCRIAFERQRRGMSIAQGGRLIDVRPLGNPDAAAPLLLHIQIQAFPMEADLGSAHHFPLAQQAAARLIVLVVESGQRAPVLGDGLPGPQQGVVPYSSIISNFRWKSDTKIRKIVLKK